MARSRPHRLAAFCQLAKGWVVFFGDQGNVVSVSPRDLFGTIERLPQPRLGLETRSLLDPRVAAKRGNPGLTYVTALRYRAALRYRTVDLFRAVKIAQRKN